MTSIIFIILNAIREFFGCNDILQIRRFPPRKILYANQLGLTFALLVLSLVFYFNRAIIFFDLPWYVSPLLLLIFAVGTYYGGVFICVSALYLSIAYLAKELFSYNPTGFWDVVYKTATGYIGGYTFGAILALLYNDFIFLLLMVFPRDRVKVVFAYDRKETFNIIKSPLTNEEKAFNKLLARDENLKEKKLYDFRVEPPENYKPYTILLVANPKVLRKRKDKNIVYEHYRKDKENYYKDPIVCNLGLFLRSVEQAVSTFEHNEVMGRPEIWSRIRVATIFDPELAEESGEEYGCVEEYQHEFTIDNEVIENLVDPMEQMIENVKRMLENYNVENNYGITINDIDVIYALTAAPEHERSTAHFSEWLETEDSYKIVEESMVYLKDKIDSIPIRDSLRRIKNNLYIGEVSFIEALKAEIGEADTDTYKEIIKQSALIPFKYTDGECFTFDPNPDSIKDEKIYDENCEEIKKKISEINVDTCSKDEENIFTCKHEYFAAAPGRVALNVLEARNRVYIHEFAHAMSSAYRGAITDEYADRFVKNNSGSTIDVSPAPFYVNKIKRSNRPDRVIPVHKIFAKFNDVFYFSDLVHPSAEEDWLGYFPDRINRGCGCTMDRLAAHYEFDKLIHDFMYDRMMAKINRK
jgi:hypothetical protein